MTASWTPSASRVVAGPHRGCAAGLHQRWAVRAQPGAAGYDLHVQAIRHGLGSVAGRADPLRVEPGEVGRVALDTDLREDDELGSSGVRPIQDIDVLLMFNAMLWLSAGAGVAMTVTALISLL
jgi:hypothetical protein